MVMNLSIRSYVKASVVYGVFMPFGKRCLVSKSNLLPRLGNLRHDDPDLFYGILRGEDGLTQCQ